MKVRLLFFFVFLQAMFLYSQTIKTYSGVFEKGTAAYQYYENEIGERLYNGKFTYNELPRYSNNNTHIKIFGSFKNGLKEGNWIFRIYDSPPNSESITITGSFSKGKPHGVFNHKKTNGTKKFIDNRIITYFNGSLRGLIEFDIRNSYSTPNYIKGFVDENNFMDSTWTVKYDVNKIVTTNYRHGPIYKRVFKNISTGEIIIQKDVEDSNYEEFYTSKSMIDGVIGFAIDETYLGNGFSQHYGENFMFYINSPTEKNIKGNLSMEYPKLEPSDEDNFKSLVLKADSNFNAKKYSTAIDLYKYSLEFVKDQNVIEKIKQVKEILAEIERLKKQE